MNQAVLDLILANVRTPHERSGDVFAQIAANQRGTQRFVELVTRYGSDQVHHYMKELLVYTERMTRQLLTGIPEANTVLPISLTMMVSQRTGAHPGENQHQP